MILLTYIKKCATVSQLGLRNIDAELQTIGDLNKLPLTREESVTSLRRLRREDWVVTNYLTSNLSQFF